VKRRQLLGISVRILGMMQNNRLKSGDLLTPQSRVILEKLTGVQLVNKFPAFYGTRRFITAVTGARHLPLSSASSIQSIPPTYHFLKIHLNIINLEI